MKQPPGNPTILLEPHRLRDWLATSIDWPAGTHLDRVDLARLWVGKHALITFELFLHLQTDQQTRRVTLQGKCVPLTPQRTPHIKAKVTSQGLLGVRLSHREWGWQVCSPDRDRRLPLLRKLLGGDPSSIIVDEILAEALDSEAMMSHELIEQSEGGQENLSEPIRRCQLIAYRLGKRCTLHLAGAVQGQPVDLFVKVFRRKPRVDFSTLQKIGSQLHARSDGLINLPPLVRSKRFDHMLMTLRISRSASESHSHLDSATQAARILQTLHDIELPGLDTHTPNHEWQTVCRWIDGLRDLGDDRYLRLRELTDTLACLKPSLTDSSLVPIHRDFYASQILNHGDRIYLIDLDTVCLGHPEQDLATYSAHLILEQLLLGASAETTWQGVRKFLQSYQDAGGLMDRSRWSYYMGCALGRLGAIHLCRGVPSDLVDSIWSLAHRSVDGTMTL